MQLTFDQQGHCINSTQCFSPDGQWIVFDSRNHDTLLASSGEIKMINVSTKEQKLLFKTGNQTEYGPGVGAVTFSPDGKRVVFLSGITNADKEHPYTITRRSGIAVKIGQPMVPVHMDARDIRPPYTPGALRGGTHAHSWSSDGQWISFTYNDYVLQQAEKLYPDVKDLRTIGVMFPQRVAVNGADGIENFSGEMFAVLLAAVVPNPAPGSDEISKAFDECWIGVNGYKKENGSWQKRAMAFQGMVRDSNGKEKAEVFVADIPEMFAGLDDVSLRGTDKTLPSIPKGVKSRRVTFTKDGIASTPRHWLRSTPDGNLIGFLAKDKNGIVQLFGVSPNGGAIHQCSFLDHSVEGPFNFSTDGRYAAFLSDDSVFLCDVKTGESTRLTKKENGLVGAVVWSPLGNRLCYNKYVAQPDGKSFLQIFVITPKSFSH
ncbi:MAG: DUF3748 domain-containing protein [Niabella sp.]